jgi:hypothetical protein
LGAHPLSFQEWSDGRCPRDGLHLAIAHDDPLDDDSTEFLAPRRRRYGDRVREGSFGAATVWLGWQTRQARIEARAADEKRILRGALAEQLDNCRTWVSHDPARGEPSVESLRGTPPRLDTLQSVVQQLNLPADLVPYLVWLIGTIEEQSLASDSGRSCSTKGIGSVGFCDGANRAARSHQEA